VTCSSHPAVNKHASSSHSPHTTLPSSLLMMLPPPSLPPTSTTTSLHLPPCRQAPLLAMWAQIRPTVSFFYCFFHKLTKHVLFSYIGGNLLIMCDLNPPHQHHQDTTTTLPTTNNVHPEGGEQGGRNCWGWMAGWTGPNNIISVVWALG
jgi:hypothetical protein